MTRTTGYYVFCHGLKWWHRTARGAYRRYNRERWTTYKHIVRCSDGTIIHGLPF